MDIVLDTELLYLTSEAWRTCVARARCSIKNSEVYVLPGDYYATYWVLPQYLYSLADSQVANDLQIHWMTRQIWLSPSGHRSSPLKPLAILSSTVRCLIDIFDRAPVSMGFSGRRETILEYEGGNANQDGER